MPTAQENNSRILFTGDWGRMIENVMEHTPRDFELERCAPVEAELEKKALKFQPHTIVIGLSSDNVRMYYILCSNPLLAQIPIIVLGRQEDCDLFETRTPCKHLVKMARPIDLDALGEALSQQCQAHKDALEVQAQAQAQTQAQENAPVVTPLETLLQTSALSGMLPTDSLDAALQIDNALLGRIERLSRLKGRKSILVADDDVTMLNILKMYLQDLYDVTVVPSGRLALKYLEKRRVDLVLLDYMMPEMDGARVLQTIRTESSQRNVPVLFLTGVSDKELVIRSLAYNPNGYLLKPTSRQMLLERVTEILLGL